MTRAKILLITKGHPFDRAAFFELFDALDVDWTHVEQPAARVFFDVSLAKDYDAFVLYDMPGLQFGADGPVFENPDDAYKQGFLNLLNNGKGMLFMHHALAGWPAWPEYAEIIGGRFLYLPGSLRNRHCQDSGYRHEVTHTISVVSDHPITNDLPSKFQMTDELYLAEIFEKSVTPLLESDYSFVQDNFYSAAKAVNEGKMFDNENWLHSPGSNLVGWTKTYGRSPIAYIQGGDDPIAYGNTDYRKLLGNAIRWVADPANLVSS
jgi:hypothetical protein